MNEEIETLSNEINDLEEIRPKIFNIDILKNKNKNAKYVQLFNGQGDKSYELKKRIYKFDLKEACFICSVEFITSTEDVDLENLKISYINFKDNENTFTFRKSDKQWYPNEIIKSFTIISPKRWFDKIIVNKIETTGYSINEFDNINKQIEKLDSYKIELKENLDELVNKNNEYEDKEDKLVELNEEIPKLENSKTIFEVEINNLKDKKESLTSENKALTNSTSQLNTESNSLNQEIPKQKMELKKLIQDKSIFSTEMAEYITQANNHMWTYFLLSFVPWVLIVTVSLFIFNKANSLSTVYDSLNGKIDIYAIFWTNVPLALITVSILFISYEISKMFAQNMMKIQSQKRIFAKIGIVAKDVADSSILELKDLSDNDKFELRTKIKMDLLKAHLSNDIGENYEYKMKTSLFEHLPKLFEKKTK